MLTSKLLKAVKVLVLTSVLTVSVTATQASGAVPSGKTTVIYFGQVSAEDFESKVRPVFEERVRSCKNCELMNYTPYKKEGAVDEAALLKRIDSLPENTSFVFFDFNLKASEAHQNLIQALNKRADAGLVVVGSAGIPKENESSGPLSRTVLGQVRSALIIGELGERDRLVPAGFYGPEMLTALRPPKNMMDQGYSPLIFAAALAEKWPQRSSQEWVEHFRTKKMKSRKIWLDLRDVF